VLFMKEKNAVRSLAEEQMKWGKEKAALEAQITELVKEKATIITDVKSEASELE
jgi:hypothetical protein